MKPDHGNLNKFSAMVRARMLFRKEIRIFAGSTNLVDAGFLEKLIEQKSHIEREMTKILSSAIFGTLLLYLVGSDVNPIMPHFGIEASDIPGVMIFLSLTSSFALGLASYSFMNSQSYDALIDQVVLQVTQDGVLDPDVLKAVYSKEWLIFKVLRRDFSVYVDAEIQMNTAGRLANSLVFSMMGLVTMAPFIILVLAQPYLTLSLLGTDWPALLTKGFSILSALSAIALIVISNTDFTCTVEEVGSTENDVTE